MGLNFHSGMKLSSYLTLKFLAGKKIPIIKIIMKYRNSNFCNYFGK